MSKMFWIGYIPKLQQKDDGVICGGFSWMKMWKWRWKVWQLVLSGTYSYILLLASPSSAAVPESQPPGRLLSPLPGLVLGFSSYHSSLSLASSPSLAPTSPTLAASSPTLTPASSPATTIVDLPSLNKKRTLGLSGLDEQSVRRSKHICVPATTLWSEKEKGQTLVAGAAAGDAGGNPGEPRRANACESRGGSSSRAHRRVVPAQAPRTISEIQSRLEQELSGLDPEEEEEEDDDTAGCRKKGKTAARNIAEKWSIKGDPPSLCAATARPVVWLSYVTTSPELQDKLKQLLIALSTTSDEHPAISDSWSPLVKVAHQCAALDLKTVVTDFHQMMSYMQFAFLYDYTRKANKRDKIPFNFAVLERQCQEASITQRGLQKWFTAGSRLIYLASASSLYIIPIFAACGMKHDVCFRHSCKQIQVLAFTLCNPAAADDTYSLTVSCGKLVREVIAPQMALIKQLSSSLDATSFSLILPVSLCVPFSKISDVHKHLRSFDVNFFPLPTQDEVWKLLQIEMLTLAIAPVLAPACIDSSSVAEEVRISTPLKLKSTKSPVSKKNRVAFTIKERVKAAKAHEVKCLEELDSEVQTFHAGARKKPDSYSVLIRALLRVLHFRDGDDQLIALVATNLADTVPHLNTTLLSQLSSVMAGEVFELKSDIDHPFLAWHCNVWNRYGEKGDDAPKGVHPEFVRKANTSKGNHSQRYPYVSKEVEENPEEAELLTEMIHLITIIVEYHLKKILPEEYEVIKVFVNQLPLNERSLAYPFGGFVINIGVATKAHRDRFDKIFCVVIPFGKWTGGELCLYEPGFVFRLKPWDILIFPSCDITHFNLDFQGVRLSLVLHSDKYGDRWVRNRNGWLPNDNEVSSEEE
ncbi:hypothetical protein B0H13DRAFT_2344360 [Mycena leptocephala]|nr:hypothetical protein B0H13DRAFT_2344360 [Mycena leptocephala]